MYKQLPKRRHQMNLVCLNGRLAADPEGAESGQGVTYATFPVAIERGSGENKSVIYLDCVTFRQQADFVRKYLHKGDGINIAGSINVRDWTDQSGIKHRKFEIVISQISFPVSGKGRNGQQAKSQGAKPEPRNGRALVGAASGGYAPEAPDYEY